jgi:hypothetical protein
MAAKLATDDVDSPRSSGSDSDYSDGDSDVSELTEEGTELLSFLRGLGLEEYHRVLYVHHANIESIALSRADISLTEYQRLGIPDPAAVKMVKAAQERYRNPALAMPLTEADPDLEAALLLSYQTDPIESQVTVEGRFIDVIIGATTQAISGCL